MTPVVRLGRGFPNKMIRNQVKLSAGPVAFDAVGSGGQQVNIASTTTNTMTFNHTVASGANRLLVPINCWDVTYTDPQISTHTRTVTYNGVSMTSLGSPTYYTAYGFLEWFDLANPATGTHSVVVTVNRTSGAGTQPWSLLTDSLSYKNVNTVTVATGQSQASGTPSVTLPTTVNGMTVAALCCSVNDPGGYNQTSRAGILAAPGYASVQSHCRIGDAAGASGNTTHSEYGSSNVTLAQGISLT